MIIEISGLPDGQKIKHISVDIDFDESGNAEVKQTIEPTPNYKESESIQELIETVDEPTTPVVKPEIKDQPKAEVPPEMKDISF